MANPTTLKTWKRRTLQEIGLRTEKQVRALEVHYIEWLAEKLGVSEREAEQRARSYAEGRDVDVAPTKSNVREEEIIGCAVIRTVRVAGARLHYAPVEGTRPWEKLPKPDAPTTYRVEIDGNPVNSFLRKSLAREYARRLVA